VPVKTNIISDIKKIKVTKYVSTKILLSLKCFVIPVSHPLVGSYSSNATLFSISLMLYSQGFILLLNLQLIKNPKEVIKARKIRAGIEEKLCGEFSICDINAKTPATIAAQTAVKPCLKFSICLQCKKLSLKMDKSIVCLKLLSVPSVFKLFSINLFPSKDRQDHTNEFF